MAINPPNPGTFLAAISQAVVNLRNDFQTVENINAYILAMGGATFLEAASPNGLGLSPADAAIVLATIGNLNNLANTYNGGAPGNALNYNANSQPLWGGQ